MPPCHYDLNGYSFAPLTHLVGNDVIISRECKDSLLAPGMRKAPHSPFDFPSRASLHRGMNTG